MLLALKCYLEGNILKYYLEGNISLWEMLPEAFEAGSGDSEVTNSSLFTSWKFLLNVLTLPTVPAKGRGEVYTQLLPCSPSRHQHAPGNSGCFCNGIKEGENNQQGSKLLFKCKYLWEEASEGKEIMKTPVKNTELGRRLINQASPPAGLSLLHLPSKWETHFQKRFANGTHPSHP